MALSGTHISISAGGTSGKRGLTLPVKRKATLSQTMASAGTTTIALPADAGELGESIFHVINSTAAIYVSIGATPDATRGPRDYIPAGEAWEIGGDVGDKLAWILA
jgi:hypothetical protein